MAPHSSTFAWKIPWTEEPGGPSYFKNQYQLYYTFGALGPSGGIFLWQLCVCVCVSRSVMSNSLRPHGL